MQLRDVPTTTQAGCYSNASIGNGASMTLEFEVRGQDVDRERPSPQMPNENGMPAERLQAYLSSNVKSGDLLSLSLVPATAHGESLPRYSVRHHERIVGLTTQT